MKNPVYKKLWFWVIIVLIVILIIFFFPKDCGGIIGEPSDTLRAINCSCIGFKHAYNIIDASITSCYGICLKSICKVNTFPPEEKPIKNETKSNDSIITLPVFPTGNFRLTIKAYNPQYKAGQDIPIKYTIENIDNKTIAISEDVSNRIEIKDAGGRMIAYNGEGNLFFINDSFTIDPNKSASSEFIIKGEDYDLTQIGSAGGGYYNSLNFYIGEVKSNTIILRIIK